MAEQSPQWPLPTDVNAEANGGAPKYRSKSAQLTGFWRQTFDTRREQERIDFEMSLAKGLLLYPRWGSEFNSLELPSERGQFTAAAEKYEGVSDGAANRLWLFVHGVEKGELVILASRETCIGMFTGDAVYQDGRLMRPVDWFWRSDRQLPSHISSAALRGRNLWGFTTLEPDEFWSTIDAINLYFRVEIPLPTTLNRPQAAAFKPESVVNVNHLSFMQRHFSRQGLNYTRTQIADFYTALQTKGFVVLSGISGTGKSRIARHFTELLPAGIVAGESLASEETDETDIAWTRIQPYNAKYGQLVVPKAHEHLFPLIEQRVGTTVTLLVNGTSYSGRMYRDHVLHLGWKKDLRPLFADATIGSRLGVRPVYRSDRQVLANLEHIELLFETEKEVRELPATPVQNSLFLSVRPDWRDGTSLLGYYNPLTQTYEWTEFLRFIINAADNARSEHPVAWFVILDEMNLAHVEYYFADMLSVLESSRDDRGFTREPLRITFPEELASETPPQEIYLPPNLYILGTVNMDETTHAFSPKVLDRAFTMELSDVDFTNYPQLGPIDQLAIIRAQEESAFLRTFSQNYAFPQIRKHEIAAFVDAHGEIRAALQHLNTRLAEHRFHFGYRVFDEVVQFLANAERNGMYATQEAALDSAVFMKVLPKFSGSEARVGEPLDVLISWSKDIGDMDTENIKLPRTHARASAMKRTLEIDGFVTAF